jgi:hypothetical protein
MTAFPCTRALLLKLSLNVRFSNRLSCWLQLLLLLVLAPGCAPALKQYPPLPPINDPAHYLKNLALSCKKYSHLSGMVKLSVSGRLLNRSTRNIFFAEHPHFLRIEILGLFNQPAAYVFADNETLQLYMLDTNTMYSGAASADNIAAVTGLYLSTTDIVHVLHGCPKIYESGKTQSVTYVQKQSDLVFTITSPETVQKLIVDPIQQKVRHYRLIRNKILQFELDYYDYTYICNTALPSRIALHSHITGLRAGATLSSIRTEPFPHDVFVFTPPVSARRLSIESLWKQPHP